MMPDSVDCKNPQSICNTPKNSTLEAPIQSSSVLSASDEDPHHQQGLMEEKKQKRMLSNRESARRSRMKKQQHLDDLQAQVSQLRAENSVLLNRFNSASQNYMAVEEQNRILRSLVMDLSSQLNVLNGILQGGINNGFSHSNLVVGDLEMEKLWLSHAGQKFKSQEIHQ